MKWGLEPKFVSNHHLATINARIEGIGASRIYSGLVDSCRCVVVVDAFYEWDNKKKENIPYILRYRDSVKQEQIPGSSVFKDNSNDILEGEPIGESYLPKDVSPLLLAAVYDTNPRSGEFSCSILTKDSVGPVSKIHSRMPVILTPSTAKLWLDIGQGFDKISRDVVNECNDTALLLQSTQVSSLVNSVRNKGREVTLSVEDFKKRSFEKGLGKYFWQNGDVKKKLKTSSICEVEKQPR
jgi:putative SOS response-associated peptidase YedK